jgi:hypothetical protein
MMAHPVYVAPPWPGLPPLCFKGGGPAHNCCVVGDEGMILCHDGDVEVIGEVVASRSSGYPVKDWIDGYDK